MPSPGGPTPASRRCSTACSGKERSITGPEAGITRDAVEARWTWEGREIRLVDTAGLRRKAKVEEDLEKMSATDAIDAIKMAEVVILVIDPAIPFETQDLQIADLVEREGRAMVVAVNKWDLVEDKATLLRNLKQRVDQLLPQWKGVPIVALSAETGDGVELLMPAVLAQHKIWNMRVSTHRLNDWLEMMLEKHSPPAPKGRRIRIRYITQARTRPPTFAISSSQAGELPGDYARYLVNGLREHFGFTGVPIRMKVKATAAASARRSTRAIRVARTGSGCQVPPSSPGGNGERRAHEPSRRRRHRAAQAQHSSGPGPQAGQRQSARRPPGPGRSAAGAGTVASDPLRIDQHLVVAQDPAAARERPRRDRALAGPRATDHHEEPVVADDPGARQEHVAAPGGGDREERLHDVALDERAGETGRPAARSRSRREGARRPGCRA